MLRRVSAQLMLIGGVLFAGGCESKFNHGNFEMIRVGMDERYDVRQILGEPTAEMGDVWLYDDLDHHHSAQIFFGDDGRVVNKEWMDAGSGRWEGANPWTDQPGEGAVRERRSGTGRHGP